MKKIVISGSVSLQEKIKYWKQYWEKKNFEIIDLPEKIDKNKFYEIYPKVYEEFFKNLNKTDILFVMNEDKNNIPGYIGAETFAELCYVVAQNLLREKKVEIILMQDVSEGVQSKDEINLWLELGWIKIFER